MTTLTSPHDLLAAIPFLIGYHPSDSLVLVSIKDGAVAMAMRVDYPLSETPSDFEVLVQHLVRDGADSALVVAYVPEGLTNGEEILARLADALSRSGIAVSESLLIAQGRWRSTVCNDRNCCPMAGRELPEITASRVAVEQVSKGRTMPFANAAELADSIATLPLASEAEFIAQVKSFWVDPEDPQLRAREKDGAIAVIDLASRFIAGSIGADFLADQELSAKVIGALSDIQVRDFALGSHVSATHDIYWQMWRYLLRVAPVGFVAPVACLLAATSYERGDGALAHRALDRALIDDPTYSLAALLRRVFSAGWPPDSFAQMRKELHPKVCAAIFEN
jgi:hypothetical protein